MNREVLGDLALCLVGAVMLFWGLVQLVPAIEAGMAREVVEAARLPTPDQLMGSHGQNRIMPGENFLFPPVCKDIQPQNVRVCVSWDPFAHRFEEVARVALPVGPKGS